MNLFLLNGSFEDSADGWFANYLGDKVTYRRQNPGPYGPNFAHDGSGFLEVSTTQGSGSIAQDVPNLALQVGQRFSFSVWLRAAPGVAQAMGTVAIWGLGAGQQNGSIDFTAGAEWNKFTAYVTISNTGLVALRAEIYLNTVGVHLEVDGAEILLESGPGWKPTQVRFKHQGNYTGNYILYDSHFSSLDDESYFTDGNPDQAEILGSKYAQCTFFDDKDYNLDENALLISLNRAGTPGNPILVNLAWNRLGRDSHPDGVYRGTEDDISWILFKNAKAPWTQTALTIGGDFFTVAQKVASAAGQTQWATYAGAGLKGIEYLQGLQTPGSSDNSRVDNVSSVLFGSQEG